MENSNLRTCISFPMYEYFVHIIQNFSMGILNGGEKSNSICSSWKVILDLLFEISLYSSLAELWALKSYHFGCLHLHGADILVQEKFRLGYSMIKFAIHIMCCPIIQSQSVVFGNRKKHDINSISGLSPISSCFCPVHKRKIHVRSSSKTALSHNCSALSSDACKSLILLAQSWSYWLLLPRGVGDTKSHPWGAGVSVLACFLTFFNQIFIGCSHLLHYSQTVSCRSEKKWIFHALGMLFHAFGIKTDLLVWKLAGKENCIGNSNYYLQKL